MAQTGTRAAATTAAIEEAALDLALAHGYETVTVDRICEQVGISQRTFFNHFPTKDDAILGREMPSIDERAARAFVLADGPLLLDALLLIPVPEGDAAPPRMDERMRIIAAHPHLLARQIERVSTLEAELREIIAQRIAHADPTVDDAARGSESALITCLMGGMMRFASSEASAARRGESMAARVEEARGVLERVLAR